MKKNLLWMMAAILTCSLMTACSSSDDNDDKKENSIEVLYSTTISDDMLKVADLTVVYIDQAGNKQQETVTSKEWKKSINSKTLPMTAGICLKATPKGSIAEGEYKLDISATAAIAGVLSSGKGISEVVGTYSSATRTADKVAEFCNALKGTAVRVDTDGKVTEIDYNF